MEKPKSSWTSKLEELGFRKVEGENMHDEFEKIVVQIEESVGRKLVRKERRRVLSFMKKDIKNNPSYTITRFGDGKEITEATDDAGQMWEAQGSIHLKAFGFINNAELMINLLTQKQHKVH